jgi:hypothetical protein
MPRRWIANVFHKDQFCQKLHARLWNFLDRNGVVEPLRRAAGVAAAAAIAL